MTKPELPKILLLKMGTAEAAVAAQHGDYDDWFMRGLEDGERRCTGVASWLGQTLPRAANYGGIILTGSPLSVRDEAPWMQSVARWALSAAEAGIPVLAVCFGHQLLGETLGGRVEPSPDGGEYGTIDVELTEAGRKDPLFAGLAPRLRVQATHRDSLTSPPTRAGVLRLAGSDHCPWQAFALGPNLRCVQFHPELPPKALVDLLKLRGIDARVDGRSDGATVLRNWDRRWVRRDPPPEQPHD